MSRIVELKHRWTGCVLYSCEVEDTCEHPIREAVERVVAELRKEGRAANLSAADLRDADLRDADLRAADLRDHWADALTRLGACGEALMWALYTTSATAALAACAREDWLDWLRSRLDRQDLAAWAAEVDAAHAAVAEADRDRRPDDDLEAAIDASASEAKAV